MMMGTKLHEVFEKMKKNQSLPKDYLVHMVDGDDYKNTTENAHHVIQDMLHFCMFGEEQCGWQNFTW